MEIQYNPYKWSQNPTYNERGPPTLWLLAVSNADFLCLSLVEEDLDVDIMFCCWVETTSF